VELTANDDPSLYATPPLELTGISKNVAEGYRVNLINCVYYIYASIT
jgi:hypothetical protein